MGRTKVEVNKSKLSCTIEELESRNTFSNRNQLSHAIAEALGISPSVVLLRIKEYNLQPKTPIGKRGRQAGIKLTDAHKLAMQSGRRSKNVRNMVEMKRAFPLSRHQLIDKVGNGSLAAAVKAKCLECAGFQTVEIKNCTCNSCPLWSFRPYQ